MTQSIDPTELTFALRVLVHEARRALAGIRPVIAGLLEPDAPPPPADEAVAQLNAVERVLNQVASVYRRRTTLRDQLEPAEFDALLRAVYSLPVARGEPPGDMRPILHEELEIALRVLVHEVGNALTSVKPLVDILHRNPAYLWRLPPPERAASARLALGRVDDTAEVLAQIDDLRPRIERVRLADVIAAVVVESIVRGPESGGPESEVPSPKSRLSTADSELPDSGLRTSDLGLSPSIHAGCPPGLCAWADALWLRHSLRNLVDNARRVTPPGGFVAIAGHARGDDVVLSVSDSGPGLAQDELDYIFHADLEARTQLRRPLAINGAGIGLSLVRYWVHAMGGAIEANSRQVAPAGTTVTLVLPRAEDVL